MPGEGTAGKHSVVSTFSPDPCLEGGSWEAPCQWGGSEGMLPVPPPPLAQEARENLCGPTYSSPLAAQQVRPGHHHSADSAYALQT